MERKWAFVSDYARLKIIYENDSNKDACYVAAGSLFVAGGIRELYMNKHDSVRYFG